MLKLENSIRTAILGAYLTIIGILVSGPIGVVFVNLVHPSPAWQGAEIFAENFHPIQTFPFFGGIFLVSGYITMLSAFFYMAEEKHKTSSLIALVFTIIFSVFIFLNYVAQLTYIPALAHNYTADASAAISIFSLSNPHSFAWAVEMWGYAFLGVATILSARLFSRNALERLTAFLLILNGILSIAGVIFVIVDLGWVFTLAGIWSYILWNILVLAISIVIVISLRRRLSENYM